MNRLTTDKKVSEMSMTELAYNCCYVKEHEVRYRDYETDVEARVLARKLLEEHEGWDGAFYVYDNKDFDAYINECLMYGMDTIEGLIAVFYRNLLAMADLRERLRKYEDKQEWENEIIRKLLGEEALMQEEDETAWQRKGSK